MRQDAKSLKKCCSIDQSEEVTKKKKKKKKKKGKKNVRITFKAAFESSPEKSSLRSHRQGHD